MGGWQRKIFPDRLAAHPSSDDLAARRPQMGQWRVDRLAHRGRTVVRAHVASAPGPQAGLGFGLTGTSLPT